MSTSVFRFIAAPDNPANKHHYVAPAYAARCLGRRVFSSKAEFFKRMHTHYLRGGREHPAKVRQRNKTLRAQVALEDAPRVRRCLWDGVDPYAARDDQVNLMQRKRTISLDDEVPLSFSGVRRCIRTEEEVSEVNIVDFTALRMSS